MSHTTVIPQPGDGSCLFHSLAHASQHTNAYQLRQDICTFISTNPTHLIDTLPISEWVKSINNIETETPMTYTNKMKHTTTWGDALELGVASIILQSNIHVYQHEPTTSTRHPHTIRHSHHSRSLQRQNALRHPPHYTPRTPTNSDHHTPRTTTNPHSHGHRRHPTDHRTFHHPHSWGHPTKPTRTNRITTIRR